MEQFYERLDSVYRGEWWLFPTAAGGPVDSDVGARECKAVDVAELQYFQGLCMFLALENKPCTGALVENNEHDPPTHPPTSNNYHSAQHHTPTTEAEWWACGFSAVSSGKRMAAWRFIQIYQRVNMGPNDKTAKSMMKDNQRRVMRGMYGNGEGAGGVK